MTPPGNRPDRPLEIFPVEAEEPIRLSYRPPPPSPPPAEGAPREESTLGEGLAVLAEGRWLIAGAAAVTLALGLLYGLLATPTYGTDVLVQVEEKKSDMGALDDLSALFSGSSPTEAEIEILRSRALVGSVVDELKLDVVAGPRYFPVVGRAAARGHDEEAPATAWLGLSRFAWGGERIAIQRLEVPHHLEGERLTLVAGGDGSFTLLGPEREHLLAGRVGQSAAAGERGRVSAFVTDLVARPGTEFQVVKLARDEAIERLQRELVIGEVGKKTGIIRLSLEGFDRKLIAGTLDALARAYLRQNVERRSAEAEKTLEFLEKQLPVLKANLDAAESAMNAHRSRNGTVDITLETEGKLARAVEVEKLLSELEVERADLRQRFTDSHPILIAVKQKIAQLQGDRAAVEAKIKQLPKEELESARLMRDVKVANELYVLLLNRAQELRVVKSGTIGNVRIVDVALVPRRPVSPKKALTAVMALFLGVGLGVALALTRKALDHGVEDPDVIEHRFGVSVYAAVPHSPKVAEIEREHRRNKTGAVPLLAVADPSDVAIESLRSLRTSLEFALVEAGGNVIAIGGPSPGVGKSFLSLNLASVLASMGKRVLLVDGDMRKGRLHRQFGVDRAPGLSELITGTAAVEDAVRTTVAKEVWLLPTGRIPSNPSELLASDRFRRVLGELSRRYDLVLIDTPPILAVTDATLIGRAAGMMLVVLRAGHHPLREISVAVKRLAQVGVRPHGFVLNDVMPRSGVLGSKYSSHYQYDYR
jgi:tyrosine-protein kinase Etk/Wzc